MNDDWEGGAAAGAEAAMPLSTRMATDRSAGCRTSRRVVIDCWGAALERGDGVEVDRLVRQSRADRVEVAASGRMGPMVGQLDPPSLIGAVE